MSTNINENPDPVNETNHLNFIAKRLYLRRKAHAEKKETEKKETQAKLEAEVKGLIQQYEKIEKNIKVFRDKVKEEETLIAQAAKIKESVIENEQRNVPAVQAPFRDALEEAEKEAEKAKQELETKKAESERAKVEAYAAEAKLKAIKTDNKIKKHLLALKEPKQSMRREAFATVQKLRDNARREYKKHGRELAKRNEENAKGERIVGGFKKGISVKTKPELQADRITRQARRAVDSKTDHGFYEALTENALALGEKAYGLGAESVKNLKLSSTVIYPATKAYQDSAKVRDKFRNQAEVAEYRLRPMTIWDDFKHMTRDLFGRESPLRDEHRTNKVADLRLAHEASNAVMDATLKKDGKFREDIFVVDVKDIKALANDMKNLKVAQKETEKLRQVYKHADFNVSKKETANTEREVAEAKSDYNLAQNMMKDLVKNPKNVKSVTMRITALNEASEMRASTKKELRNAEKEATNTKTKLNVKKTSARIAQDKMRALDAKDAYEIDTQLVKATFDTKADRSFVTVAEIKQFNNETNQLKENLNTLKGARSRMGKLREEVYVNKETQDRSEPTGLKYSQKKRRAENAQANYEFGKKTIKAAEEAAVKGDPTKVKELKATFKANKEMTARMDKLTKNLEKAEQNENNPKYNLGFTDKSEMRKKNDVMQLNDMQNDYNYGLQMQKKIHEASNPNEMQEINNKFLKFDALKETRDKSREISAKANINLETHSKVLEKAQSELEENKQKLEEEMERKKELEDQKKKMEEEVKTKKSEVLKSEVVEDPKKISEREQELEKLNKQKESANKEMEQSKLNIAKQMTAVELAKKEIAKIEENGKPLKANAEAANKEYEKAQNAVKSAYDADLKGTPAKTLAAGLETPKVEPKDLTREVPSLEKEQDLKQQVDLSQTVVLTKTQGPKPEPKPEPSVVKEAIPAEASKTASITDQTKVEEQVKEAKIKNEALNLVAQEQQQDKQPVASAGSSVGTTTTSPKVDVIKDAIKPETTQSNKLESKPVEQLPASPPKSVLDIPMKETIVPKPDEPLKEKQKEQQLDLASEKQQPVNISVKTAKPLPKAEPPKSIQEQSARTSSAPAQAATIQTQNFLANSMPTDPPNANTFISRLTSVDQGTLKQQTVGTNISLSVKGETHTLTVGRSLADERAREERRLAAEEKAATERQKAATEPEKEKPDNRATLSF